ncbi:MAG: response regulator [Desulfatiglandaceae bacterium]
METAETEMPQSGEGTILVVEDEVSVLRLTRRVLEKLGYTVLSTQSPDKALNMVREHTEKIHLLITDVVLPEMSGKELAEKITGLRPDIKVLFMSGYTADIIGRHGVLDEGVSFIEKPFSLGRLARRVREAIESEE